MNIEDLIKDKIEKYSLDQAKSLVAVSGGPDSMALLYLLAQNLKKENLVVAHIDHGLRKESKEEKKLVETLARKLGLEFFFTELKLKSRSEDEARAKRYEYLESVAQKNDADFIILAHHADDQLETIILKLIRGTNPVDLWGMDEVNGLYLRPLLEISKEEILSYCKAKKIVYVIDASNKDLNYARNRIRNKVVPELKIINPNLLETVNKQKKVYAELKNYLQKSTFWGKLGTYKNGHLNLKTFKRLPLYMQKTVLRDILKEKLPERELTQENILEVMRVIESSGTKTSSIGKLKIDKEYDKLSFHLIKATKTEALEQTAIVENKSLKFGDFKLIFKKGLAAPAKNNILLPKKLTYNLSVRDWHNGDKIVTMTGSKKLQDIFSDAKIPQKERKSWPVVVSGEEIIWLPLLSAHRDCLKKPAPDAWYIEVKNERK